MKYYKFTDEEGNVTYQSHTREIKHPRMQEITEVEYNGILEELRAKAEEENLSSDEISAEEFMSLVEELL